MTNLVNKIPNPALYGRDIKLLCFDLDGTLVNSKGEISTTTINEIQRVRKEHGVTVVMATGRPLFSADYFVDLIGARGASMFYAGALITDVETRIPAFECHLPRPEAEAIVSFCRENKLSLELYSGEEYFVDEVTDNIAIHRDHYLKHEPQVLDLKKLASRERFLKAVIAHSPQPQTFSSIEALAKTSTNWAVTSATGAMHNDIIFTNFTNAYASRTQAFQALLEQHRVKPHQVMSFGDAPADETFIKLAGVGIAMGNSPESLKNVANLITTTADEDGVAFALRHIFD
jgi:Cof subfamily protein (haloacid dehalogenase superfamily)